jgi:FkbM family methyltransferase
MTRANYGLRGVARVGYHQLNAMFRSIGFKLVRVDRPTRSFDEFFEHIRKLGFQPRTVVDVGAASGTISLHQAFPKAKFILVEPLEEFREPLQCLARNYDCELCFAAAGNSAGTVAMRVSQNLYGSAISTRGQDHEREIPLIILDDLLKTVGAEPPLLVKIDVQGYELRVVEGLSKHLPLCEVIILEASTYRVSEDPPDLHTLVSYMKSNSFSVYDILDGIMRPYDNALGQVDLVFVRDDGPFRTYQGWA